MKQLIRRFYILVSALIILAGGSAAAWMMHLGASKLPLRQYFPRTQTNAVWDWTDPEGKSQNDLDSISEFMYLHQLNAVYVGAGDRYLSIARIKSPAEQAAERERFENALSRYVTTLSKRKIKVYAAAGDVSWSNQDKQGIPLSVLYAVENYNNRHPQEQLAGIEFDIEAYNQPGFAPGSMTVKSLVLTDWLDMVDKLAAENALYTSKLHRRLELGFAIPYWFDDENGNIPAVTWQNKTGPTLYHLLDRLNQLPQSNVVVMAYRNAARGNDGIIYHARTEVEYAQAKAPRVRVIIGQELNNVEPEKVTYYGHSATELSSQAAAVGGEFRDNRAYAGIAINDLAAFQQMESGR
jgi:hypothetical protein